MTLDRRAFRAVGTILVAFVAVLVWWLQSDDTDGGPEQRVAGSESTATAGTSPSTSPRPTGETSDEGPSVSAEPDSGPSASTYAPRSGIDRETGLAWVAVDDLPDEAGETLELIDAGGPFPHDRDDITFGNYEGILPAQARGHYREYTVPTPGLDHRGARRIVTGDDDEYFWTEDHYATFERIDWPEDRR